MIRHLLSSRKKLPVRVPEIRDLDLRVLGRLPDLLIVAQLVHQEITVGREQDPGALGRVYLLVSL